MFGARVEVERAKTAKHGRYIYKDYGDVLGTMWWDPDGRHQGAWQLAPLAAQVTFVPPAPAPGGGGGSVMRGAPDPRNKVRPTRNEDWEEDDDFVEVEAAHDDDWQGVFPKGWGALLAAGTKGDSYEQVLFPAFHGCVAASRREHHLGTWVFDINDDQEADSEFRARLHSMMRVVRPRGDKWSAGGQENALAWMLDRTDGNDKVSGWGLVVGQTITPPRVGQSKQERVVTGGGGSGGPPPTTPLPTAAAGRVLGAAAARLGGPFEPSGEGDQHILGRTADGEPINPVHLPTQTLFIGKGGDGPIEFDDLLYRDPGPYPFRSKGWLRWDPTVFHETPEGTFQGKWRFINEIPIYIPPPDEPPVCFVAGTMVEMLDGSEASIESLQVGDRVRSNTGPGKVTRTHADVAPYNRVVFEGGALEVTGEHPLFVIERGFTKVHDLQAGDRLLCNGAPAQVISVESAGVAPVYNVTVEPGATYFANGVLVHNKSFPPDDPDEEDVPDDGDGGGEREPIDDPPEEGDKPERIPTGNNGDRRRGKPPPPPGDPVGEDGPPVDEAADPQRKEWQRELDRIRDMGIDEIRKLSDEELDRILERIRQLRRLLGLDDRTKGKDKKKRKYRMPWIPMESQLPYVASMHEMAAPGFLLRATEHSGIGPGHTTGKFSRRPTPEMVRNSVDLSPGVLRLVAMAEQEGPWQFSYTQKFDKGRSKGGTAPGYVVLLPPELDGADLETDFARNDIAVSTSYWVHGPGVRQAWGIPRPAMRGSGLESGFSQELDGKDVVLSEEDQGTRTEWRRLEHGKRRVCTDHGVMRRLDVLTSGKTLGTGDHIIMGDTAGGGFTVTLPATAPSSSTKSQHYILKNVGGGNTLTVDPNGNNIDGDPSNRSLSDGQVLEIYSRNGNWETV